MAIFLRSQKGAAAVEFSLVLPIFIVLVFGIIEFSLMLYDKAVITNASREAARAGIVLKSPKMSVDEIKAVALNYCENYLITLGGATSPVVSVPSGAGGAFGSSLTVSISYNYSGLVLGKFISSLSGPISLAATTVMKNE
ncbi:TadE/TadG family type IV pilus assembly protein [Cupriavidus sp. Agwp_2]|uniref:TadE/TadG family type IV pilus assembly protein n=1 Tax=Cupriavidus sp. Agwp_2 TaxID=2897324 RepID=UPI00345FD0FD